MNDGNRVHNWRSAQYQFENNNNNNDKAIKEFEIWVKISNGNWQQIGDTFTAQKSTSLQEFDLDDIQNVSDLRIKTLSNYGNSYYIEAKEFEIIGQNPNTHHTFTAQKSTSLQEFDLDDIHPNTHHTFTAQKSTSLQEFDLDDIQNVSDLRIKIISNYGNYYYVLIGKLFHFKKHLENFSGSIHRMLMVIIII